MSFLVVSCDANSGGMVIADHTQFETQKTEEDPNGTLFLVIDESTGCEYVYNSLGEELPEMRPEGSQNCE